MFEKREKTVTKSIGTSLNNEPQRICVEFKFPAFPPANFNIMGDKTVKDILKNKGDAEVIIAQAYVDAARVALEQSKVDFEREKVALEREKVALEREKLKKNEENNEDDYLIIK